VDRDGVFGIETSYGLDASRIESRGGGGGFSASCQPGPENDPASYTMGTGTFAGVKRPVFGLEQPLSSSAFRNLLFPGLSVDTIAETFASPERISLNSTRNTVYGKFYTLS
jgi:hypothetical protein